MKKIALSFILSIVAVQLFAQEVISLNIDKKAVGTNLATNTEVIGTQHVFNKHIATVKTNEEQALIFLRDVRKNGKYFRNTGNLAYYNIEQQNIKWTTPYSIFDETWFSDECVYHFQQGVNTHMLSKENGANLRTIKGNVFYLESDKNKCITIKRGSSASKITGIQLTSGETEWKRKIKHELGAFDYYYISDSVIVIDSNGLHSININNGTGWDYNTPTMTSDYSGVIAGGALAIATGVLFGTYIMPTQPNYVTDIKSDPLQVETSLYFASREKLSCIDIEGKEIWTVPFNKNIASSSALELKDSTIVMINNGYAKFNGETTKFGQPFIGGYNMYNGEKYFNIPFNKDSMQINNYSIDGDKLTLIFGSAIHEYSIPDGKLILKKEFDTSVYGSLLYFVGDRLYTKHNNSFLNIYNNNDSTTKVFTTKNYVLKLDNKTAIADTVHIDNFYINHASNELAKIIANDSICYITTPDNKPIATIDIIPQKTWMTTEKIYSTKDSILTEINLQEILQTDVFDEIRAYK